MKHFYLYRYNAFLLELKALIKQLNQFLLMISTLFYIFLPGLIASLFFGLGKIVQSDSEQLSTQVVYAYLVLQTLLLNVVKPAILDREHREFQLSLVAKQHHKYIADIGLLLISHGIFLATVVLACAMGWEKVRQAPQLLLFMLTQISFSLVLLYRAHSVFWSLLIGFMIIFVSASTVQYLLFVNALLAMCWFLPVTNIVMPKFKVNIVSCWLVYFAEFPWSFLWRGAASFLVIWAALIIKEMRLDLLEWYTLAAVLLNHLWWSTLMIETNTIIKATDLYWRSLNKYKTVIRAQFMVLLIMSFIVWGIAVALLGVDRFVLASLVVAPLLLWCAANKAQYLAVTWSILSISIFVFKVTL